MRNRVRALRLKLGWSQQQLAEAAATSQQQIQRIEVGDQSVKLDLAVRLGRALKTDIAGLFPEARSAVRRKALSASELESLAASDKKRKLMNEAGLDTDSDSWFVVLGLRGGATVQCPIATEDKDRLRKNLSGLETTAPFFVFDSGAVHVAVNLMHVQLIQELWEADPTISEWAAPKFDAEEISVYFAGQPEPEKFSGSPDWEELEEEIGQFQYILHTAQLMVDEHQFFEFIDFDGEAVFLKAHDVALLAIPMWLTDPEFSLNEDLESDEDPDPSQDGGHSVEAVTP